MRDHLITARQLRYLKTPVCICVFDIQFRNGFFNIPDIRIIASTNKELQNQVKERDSQIQDLSNTKATLEAREKEIQEAQTKAGSGGDTAVQGEIQSILESVSYDPQGAAKRMGDLLKKVQGDAAKSAPPSGRK